VTETETTNTNSRPTFAVKWLMGGLIIVLLVAGVVAFFDVHVCNQQLNNKGNVVEVCRHLGASDPPVAAAGLVLLALLSFFFTEISGFGITLKREVKEAKQEARAAHAASLENKEDIRETEGDLKEVSRRVIEDHAVAEPELAKPEPAPLPDNRITELAREYNRTRLTMPRGDARTTVMTSIVNQMISAFKDVPDFDIPSYLDSTDRGLRLAAYAYLYTYPDPSWTKALARTLLEREDKPFGQYWALRALQKQSDRDPAEIDSDTKRKLQDFLNELPPGSDRAIRLQKLLRSRVT
jgi:hypothetical protein